MVVMSPLEGRRTQNSNTKRRSPQSQGDDVAAGKMERKHMSALELYKMMSTEAPPPAKNPPALVNII